MMGSNPKRTVTVQMVPQLTAVGAPGNKESGTKLSQDCPTQESKSPSQTQNTTQIGGEATQRASDESNGNVEVQQMSVDSNANVKQVCDISEVSNSATSKAGGRGHTEAEANCANALKSDANSNQLSDFKCADHQLNQDALAKSERLQSCPVGTKPDDPKKKEPSTPVSSSSPETETAPKSPARHNVASVNSSPVSSDKPSPIDSTSLQAANDTQKKKRRQSEAAAGEGQPLFREASTMTSSPSTTTVGLRQDVEVQAVADTCSKSVCTSPSLMRPAEVPEEAAPSLAAEGIGSSSSSVEPDKLTVTVEMCPNQKAEVFHRPSQDMIQGEKPKESSCNTQPVYQIDIQHNHNKDAAQNNATVVASRVDSGNTAKRTAAADLGPGHGTSSKQVQVTSKTSHTKDASGRHATKGKAASEEVVKGKSGKETKEGKDKDDTSDQQKDKNIHDVVWDEQGMTWEVYGASVDPESLGFAIQSHLQCKIKEQERKIIAQVSLRKSFSGANSPKNSKKDKRRHGNIFRSMFQNARRPNCCVRPPPASVVD